MFSAREGDGQQVADPSHAEIRAMVARLDTGGDSFVVIEESGSDRFVQTLRLDTDAWTVERHDAERDEHLSADVTSSDQVVAALIGWMSATPGWHSAYTWTDISDVVRKPWWQRLLGR